MYDNQIQVVFLHWYEILTWQLFLMHAINERLSCNNLKRKSGTGSTWYFFSQKTRISIRSE